MFLVGGVVVRIYLGHSVDDFLHLLFTVYTLIDTWYSYNEAVFAFR